MLDVADVVDLRGLERGPRREGPALLAGPATDGHAGRGGRGVAVEDRPGPRGDVRRQRRGPASPTSTSSTTDYEQGLQGCERSTIVVSHDAFTYLSRFGLTVEGIAGLSPDAEPTPADLARLHELITSDGHHDRLLGAAGQRPAGADPGRRPRRRDGGARPHRGAERRDRGRGLLVADAARTSPPSRRQTDVPGDDRHRPGLAHRRRRRDRRSAGPAWHRPEVERASSWR